MTEEQTITRFEGSKLVVETGNKKEVYDAEFLVAVLLVSIANSDGEMAPTEIDKMLRLISEHFELRTDESLKILVSAVESLTANPDLIDILKELASTLTFADKEDVAVMMFKVVAADGREEADEMAALTAAAEIIGIPLESLQKARQRFFAER
jgi:uncharacterized tellurite resistance protein B-like protein